MPRVKQAAKHARTTKAAAVTALGAAGLGLSLAGSASASTIPTAGIPKSDIISPNQRFVLSEEEMADVSLATFHLFDKENAGNDIQLAYVRGCRGCRAAVAAVVAVSGAAVAAMSGVAAAAAHAGDRAAFAKLHDLADERQNFTNCRAGISARRVQRPHPGGPCSTDRG